MDGSENGGSTVAEWLVWSFSWSILTAVAIDHCGGIPKGLDCCCCFCCCCCGVDKPVDVDKECNGGYKAMLRRIREAEDVVLLDFDEDNWNVGSAVSRSLDT